MPPVYLLVKPASGNCNMCCAYCFYHDLLANRQSSVAGLMQPETTEKMVKSTFAEATGACTFTFQGGEPTLAGLSYFEHFHHLVEKHNTKGLHVSYALQTNGYCLTREWTELFARHHYLVGLSLDGTRELHDAFRRDGKGAGTFTQVMNAAGLLRETGVLFNILTVVTAGLSRQAKEVYSFYRDSEFLHQQYIACLNPLDGKHGKLKYSLTAEQYGKFLCDLFDIWYDDLCEGHKVSIRYFDNLVMLLRGGVPEGCGMLGHCTRQTVIEADGTVYPCDFYCFDALALGNITADGFEKLEARRNALGFIKQSTYIAPECRACEWVGLCRGGCRRDRECPSGGSLGLNRFCKAYRRFFAHSVQRLLQAAAMDF